MCAAVDRWDFALADWMKIDIRPLEEGDLEEVERRLTSRPTEKHRRRLAAQRSGKAIYLVAWCDQAPVGHAYVKWDGSNREPMATRLSGCPEVEDIYVSPAFRSKGIGSKLLHVAEELAKARGCARIGLGVAVENPRARSLYERSGYVDSGLGQYRDVYSHLDEHGTLRTSEDICDYMVKDLTGGRMPAD